MPPGCRSLTLWHYLYHKYVSILLCISRIAAHNNGSVHVSAVLPWTNTVSNLNSSEHNGTNVIISLPGTAAPQDTTLTPNLNVSHSIFFYTQEVVSSLLYTLLYYQQLLASFPNDIPMFLVHCRFVCFLVCFFCTLNLMNLVYVTKVFWIWLSY